MPQDRDEKDDEDRVCFDFDGDDFIESTGPEVHDEWPIVEVEFSRNRRGTKFQEISAIHAPLQIEAFLAHPMTELSKEEVAHVCEINQVIVSTLQRCVDPIFSIYLPSDDFDPDGDCSGTYFDDTRMIFKSDVLIANRVYKADGVGTVIHEASQHGIPVVSIVPKNREITVLHEGLPGRVKKQLFYNSKEDLSQKLAEVIRGILPEIRTRSRQRTEEKEVWNANVGRQLFQCRLTKCLTLEELSLRTGYAPEALNELENDPGALLRPPHAMIRSLATELQAEAVINSDGIRISTTVSNYRPQHVQKSLTNLIDLFCERSPSEYSRTYDRAFVKAWSRYEEMTCALATRDPGRPNTPQAYLEVVSKEDWTDKIEYFRGQFLD